jgi:hypothetical protein
MTFDVTNTFQAGTDAKAVDLNKNFSDIENELNAFPTGGALKNGSITNAMIVDSAITFPKLSGISTDGVGLTPVNDTTLATSKAIKTYIDTYLTGIKVFGTATLTSDHSNLAGSFPAVTVRSGSSNWSSSIFTVPVTGTYYIHTAARFLMRRYSRLRIGWYSSRHSYSYAEYYNEAYTTSGVNYGWGLVHSGSLYHEAGETIKLYARADGGGYALIYGGAPISISKV